MFISISDEPGNKSTVHHYNNPYMPRTADNPYFTLEIYEPDHGALDKIMQLIPIIEKQFAKSDGYLLETTSSGFKLKKKIIDGMHTQDSWDRWNDFSNSLYKEIAKAVGLHDDN